MRNTSAPTDDTHTHTHIYIYIYKNTYIPIQDTLFKTIHIHMVNFFTSSQSSGD